jgi:hypothetical protein
MARVYFKASLIVFAFLMVAPEVGCSEETVRVLTWFGYIKTESAALKDIEKKCNAKISVDEFYSNSEFLDRVKDKAKLGTKYGVLIYSNTIADAVDDILRNSGGESLGELISGYDANVRAHFKKENHPHNAAVFQLSLTGFLFDRNNIEISPQNSLR